MIIIKELISALISVTCFDTSKHRSKLRFIARSSVSTSSNTVQPAVYASTAQPAAPRSSAAHARAPLA